MTISSYNNFLWRILNVWTGDYIPLGFQWPWPSCKQWGTWLDQQLPCSPTWSLSTLHTAPGTRSGRSGRSHSCASVGVHSFHWSCKHILCSSYQRAACQPQQKWRRWWPTPRLGFPEPPLNCQWSWSACSVLAKTLLTWKLGAKSKHKTYYQFLWKSSQCFQSWTLFQNLILKYYHYLVKSIIFIINF